MTKILSPYLDSFQLNSYLLLFVQTVISTSIILVTAEFLPKSIFKIYPNTTLRFFSFPIFCFFILFSPFAWLFIQVSKLIVKLFFGQTLTENKQFFNKTDLDDYLDHINSNNTEDSASVEVEMLQNTLDLSEKKVRECMIPRTEIIAMNINSTINDLKDKFIETNPKIGHTTSEFSSEFDYISSNVFKEDALMTETLAKIYISQNNFDKAVESYNILSLKYPEKSSLFADQIKAIKKLQEKNKNS